MVAQFFAQNWRLGKKYTGQHFVSQGMKGSTVHRIIQGWEWNAPTERKPGCGRKREKMTRRRINRLVKTALIKVGVSLRKLGFRSLQGKGDKGVPVPLWDSCYPDGDNFSDWTSLYHTVGKTSSLDAVCYSEMLRGPAENYISHSRQILQRQVTMGTNMSNIDTWSRVIHYGNVA